MEPKKDCCETCGWARFRRGACRGVMDCDPDEYWCECDNEYFYGEREYDEDGEELDCEDYSYYDPYEDYYYDDRADYYYDQMKDEEGYD